MLSRALMLRPGLASAGLRASALAVRPGQVVGPLAVGVRHRGGPPAAHFPPPPPREFEADGSPKKYPLNQHIYDHGIEWESWALLPVGIYHTVYVGDFAQDNAPMWAWIGSFPIWVGLPMVGLVMTLFAIFLQNAGSIGIKPKCYTPEWMMVEKERERAENSRPVTRYLDRRRRERGPNFVTANYLPYHVYFLWMRNSHDYEVGEQAEARHIENLKHWGLMPEDGEEEE